MRRIPILEVILDIIGGILDALCCIDWPADRKKKGK